MRSSQRNPHPSFQPLARACLSVYERACTHGLCFAAASRCLWTQSLPHSRAPVAVLSLRPLPNHPTRIRAYASNTVLVRAGGWDTAARPCCRCCPQQFAALTAHKPVGRRWVTREQYIRYFIMASELLDPGGIPVAERREALRVGCLPYAPALCLRVQLVLVFACNPSSQLRVRMITGIPHA